MHSHSSACAQVTPRSREHGCVVAGLPCRVAARTRGPLCAVPHAPCPAPLRTLPRAPTPCRKRPSARPCAVSQDTPQLARLPMSQYNIVYCNTIFFFYSQANLPSHCVTIQWLYCDTAPMLKWAVVAHFSSAPKKKNFRFFFSHFCYLKNTQKKKYVYIFFFILQYTKINL